MQFCKFENLNWSSDEHWPIQAQQFKLSPETDKTSKTEVKD